MRTFSQRMIENPILEPLPIFQPSANRNRGRLIQCGKIIAEICRDTLRIFPIFGWALRRFFGFLLVTEFLTGKHASPVGQLRPRANRLEPGEEDLRSAQSRPVDHGVRSTSLEFIQRDLRPSRHSRIIFANFSNTMGNAKVRLSATTCKNDRNAGSGNLRGGF